MNLWDLLTASLRACQLVLRIPPVSWEPKQKKLKFDMFNVETPTSGSKENISMTPL